MNLSYHKQAVKVWLENTNTQFEDLSYTHIQTLPMLQDRLMEKFLGEKLKVLGKLEHMQWLSFPITCISLSEDMRFLYSGSTDHTMKIWGLNDWNSSTVKRNTNIRQQIVATCYLLFSGSDDGSIIMWERKGKATWKWITHSRAQILLSGTSPVNAFVMKYSAAGTVELYTGLSNVKVLFWEENKSWFVSEVSSHRDKAVTSLARSPGPLVFSGSENDKFSHGGETGNGVHTLVTMLIAHEGPINCLEAKG